MANLLYVDNSNVWIEGMHVAAYKSGMATDVWTAVKGNICYHSWKIDFGKLFSFAGGDKKEVRKAAPTITRSIVQNLTRFSVARNYGVFIRHQILIPQLEHKSVVSEGNRFIDW